MGIIDFHHRVLRVAILKVKPGSARVCCGLLLPEAYSWISSSGLTAGKILDMQEVRPIADHPAWHLYAQDLQSTVASSFE